jgi:hypothetical protein
MASHSPESAHLLQQHNHPASAIHPHQEAALYPEHHRYPYHDDQQQYAQQAMNASNANGGTTPYHPTSACILKKGYLKVRGAGHAARAEGGNTFSSLFASKSSVDARSTESRPYTSHHHQPAHGTFTTKHVLLAAPRSVTDIHAIYQAMVASIDPTCVSDAKAIRFLGNIGFAAIKATPLLIILAPEVGHGVASGSRFRRQAPSDSADPVFIHFSDGMHTCMLVCFCLERSMSQPRASPHTTQCEQC